MILLKKIILSSALLLPLLIFGQNQIWYKTQKEVTELIQGNWAIISHTFEGKEKTINPKEIFGLSMYKKNDSLKVDEFFYSDNTKKEIEYNLSFYIDKGDSGDYHFCRDYRYKVHCEEIKFIDSTKLILEQGPNISTFKKMYQ